MRVVWSAAALAFIRAQAAHIRRDRPLAAERWLAGVQDAVRRLARFPRSGRAIPELPAIDAREGVDGGYRIFYRLEPGRVYVIGVQHSRQEFDLSVAGDARSPRHRDEVDRAIGELLSECAPEVRELALRTCRLIRRVLPGAVATVHSAWTMIVFGTGPRTAEMVFGVAPLGDSVTIQLAAGDLPDPAGLLERNGHGIPRVHVTSPAILDAPQLEALLHAAVEAHFLVGGAVQPAAAMEF